MSKNAFSARRRAAELLAQEQERRGFSTGGAVGAAGGVAGGYIGGGVGSLFGPIGTAVGSVVGGLAGKGLGSIVDYLASDDEDEGAGKSPSRLSGTIESMAGNGAVYKQLAERFSSLGGI